MEVINLDELVPEDKVVQLKGDKYYIPADLSVESMLRLFKVFKRLEEDGENVENQEEAFRVAHDLFTERQPDLEYEDFIKLITLKQFVHLTTAIFGDYTNTEDVQSAIDNPQKKTVRKLAHKR